ncbi:hypothetical protein [Gloeothece citriformis]|nr:hypothetical protein [Gloeothece citriformis]
MPNSEVGVTIEGHYRIIYQIKSEQIEIIAVGSLSIKSIEEE